MSNLRNPRPRAFLNEFSVNTIFRKNLSKVNSNYLLLMLLFNHNKAITAKKTARAPAWVLQRIKAEQQKAQSNNTFIPEIISSIIRIARGGVSTVKSNIGFR
jgi:hypothetical protein